MSTDNSESQGHIIKTDVQTMIAVALNKTGKCSSKIQKGSVVCLIFKVINVSPPCAIKPAYTFTNKTTQLSIKTLKSTSPWRLDPEMI